MIEVLLGCIMTCTFYSVVLSTLFLVDRSALDSVDALLAVVGHFWDEELTVL